VSSRGADLIERLLTDPELRRRFEAQPAAVLVEAGLPELAAGFGPGRRALMTLELRESRSSLAGVMVAAAAAGVDFAQFLEHATPALAHDASGEFDHLVHPPAQHPAPAAHDAASAAPKSAAPAAPATTDMSPPAAAPKLAAPVHPAPPQPATAAPSGSAAQPSSADPGAATTQTADGGAPVSAKSPAEGAKLVMSGAPAPSHAQASGGAPVAPAHHDSAHQPPAEHAAAAPEAADSGLAYPGDQAAPQQLATWMGARAEQAGLPPELPVMAALTESGLRNLSYGDRDSVGFFQMRLGIWNEGAYAGYPDHPDLQIQWFIDHALAVKAENPALAQSPGSWGEWVADVEQPAAAYRYRYQLQLGTAQELLRGAEQAPVAPVAPVAPAPVGQAALKVAMHYVGGGDRQQGASLSTGLGSSELVQYAYARQGIHVPSVAAEQFDVGTPVSRHDLRPGDAVFFAQTNGYIDHVGLYVGNGRFVSATGAGGGAGGGGGGEVTVASLSDPHFAAEYAGARRYTSEALGDPSSYARTMPTVKP
jgi:cell wall-associated NlpC family hydrolase